MNMRIEAPSALRICRHCGELASGRCDTCTYIEDDAIACATSLFRQGALSFDVIARPHATQRQQLWARIAESEFHRLRSARLHSALPTTRTLFRGRPRGLTGSDSILRRLVWPCLFIAACAAVVVLLLGAAF